jgi:predicted phosphodiesterase
MPAVRTPGDPVKYGILGDVHANLEALQVVLAEMEKARVDRLISVGDLVGYGAEPCEVIAEIRRRNSLVVAGNHDHAAIGRLNIDFFNTYARESALWTRKTLGASEKDYLGELPWTVTVEDFTVVHSTLYAPELFEYIQTSYDAHLSFEQQRTRLSFIGHSHVPVNFVKRRTVTFNTATEIRIEPDALTMINVGSIGQPRDENPKACCCIYDADEGVVRLSRHAYDVEAAGRKIRSAGLPEVLAERLKYGR